MKRKIISLISLLVVGTGVGVNNLYAIPNEVNTNTKKKHSTEIVEKEKQKETKSVEKEKEEEKKEEKATETVEESIIESNSTSASSNSSSKNNNQVNTTQSNSISSSAPSYTPPHVQTEWERLGISEYDYYNTAPPNEGEIAKDIVNCDAKAGDINIKYGLITHSGDVRSYSEKYIGCWITIHFNDGRKMFYNEFKAREDRGEFNYLLAP